MDDTALLLARDDTALLLARWQFAFTIAFHIVFPAFSIGLASYLAVLEGLWLTTKRAVYLDLFQYWVKIFALVFGMGVVSGLVMSYQFGSNWSVFADKAGPVVGPLLAYEVLAAFFLEAGFLGVMLFGREKVGPVLHYLATLMVAAGTFLSAFWILAVNSWMQTPQGFSINADGQFVPEDWLAVIFNPSFPYRLAHMLIAAYLTTALAVGAVAAFHLLRDRSNLGARTMFSMAMWMLTLVAPLQLVAGDLHGLNTLQYQPAKIMAMEGHFESHDDGAPLYLFGIPDMAAGELKHAIGIPQLGSLILRHDRHAPMPGLETVPRENWPPVPIVFWSFRVMVGLGLLMIAVGAWSLRLRLRRHLYDSKRLLRAALAMGPAGFVALIAGWVTTEVGRQPFVIYGQLRTADAAAPIGAPALASSLIAFVITYGIVFAAGSFYILRLMGRTPRPDEPEASVLALSRAAGTTPASQIAAQRGRGNEPKAER